jgi:hypothetical protein
MILWRTERTRLYLAEEQLVRVLVAARLAGRPPRSVTDGDSVRNSLMAWEVADCFLRLPGGLSLIERPLLHFLLVDDFHMATPGVRLERFPVGSFLFLVAGSVEYRLVRTCGV